VSPEARADMAVSCLEVWRENEIEMPTTAERCVLMVLDDLECLGMAARATEIDVSDIVDRIMTTLAERNAAADFWTAAAMRSDS